MLDTPGGDAMRLPYSLHEMNGHNAELQRGAKRLVALTTLPCDSFDLPTCQPANDFHANGSTTDLHSKSLRQFGSRQARLYLGRDRPSRYRKSHDGCTPHFAPFDVRRSMITTIFSASTICDAAKV